MSDEFDDYKLMIENFSKISEGEALALRVSKEHYLWLSRAPTLVRSIVHTASGLVEGHPTSEINILQRLRQLMEIESAAKSVLSHWDEFGDEYGFEEKLERLRIAARYR